MSAVKLRKILSLCFSLVFVILFPLISFDYFCNGFYSIGCH